MYTLDSQKIHHFEKRGMKMSKKVNIEEEIKSRKILDYTDAYRKQYIREIKQSYAEKCSQNYTFDEKFKEFVSNPDNIQVSFHYGWNMKVYLSYASVRINCSYTYSGSYTTGYSGTATVSSSGSVKISDVHANTERYTASHEKMYTETVIPTVRDPFVSNVGDAKYDAADAKHYVEKQAGDPMPDELKKISGKKFSFKEVDEGLCAPDNAIEKACERVKEYHRFDYKVSTSYAGMEDYLISEIELYFLPKSFDLSVEYEGKTYAQKDVKSPSDIRADGKTSDHYNRWCREADDMGERGKACRWIPKTIMSIGGFFPLFFTILKFVLSLNEEEMPHSFYVLFTFAPFGTVVVLGPAVLGIYIAVKNFDPFKRWNAHYVSSIPIYDIKKRIKKEYRALVFKRIGKALLYALACYGLGYWIYR